MTQGSLTTTQLSAVLEIDDILRECHNHSCRPSSFNCMVSAVSAPTLTSSHHACPITSWVLQTLMLVLVYMEIVIASLSSIYNAEQMGFL